MARTKIALIGGTGFVGRHLAAEACRRRAGVRVLSRRPERHRQLRVLPTVELIQANVHLVSELSRRLAGCDAVINLAGILNEGSGEYRNFDAVHVRLPAIIAEACRYNGIERLLHLSALNAVPDAPSRYLRSKAAGEAALAGTGTGLQVTVFRPSVIFGPDDAFFNRFARLLSRIPAVFPLACPRARFAPVYVGDVVAALLKGLHDKDTYGETIALCGPRAYTLAELVELTARTLGLRRRILPLSDRMSRLQARILEFLPGKPFTRDNYLSMQRDSICDGNGFEQLGLEPRSVESVLAGFLRGDSRPSRLRRLQSASDRFTREK